MTSAISEKNGCVPKKLHFIPPRKYGHFLSAKTVCMGLDVEKKVLGCPCVQKMCGKCSEGLGELDYTTKTEQECVVVKLCVLELIPPFLPNFQFLVRDKLVHYNKRRKGQDSVWIDMEGGDQICVPSSPHGQIFKEGDM